MTLFLTSLAFVSLGIVIAARMHDFEGFGSIQNFVIMPLYLLSGAMFRLAARRRSCAASWAPIPCPTASTPSARR